MSTVAARSHRQRSCGGGGVLRRGTKAVALLPFGGRACWSSRSAPTVARLSPLRGPRVGGAVDDRARRRRGRDAVRTDRPAALGVVRVAAGADTPLCGWRLAGTRRTLRELSRRSARLCGNARPGWQAEPSLVRATRRRAGTRTIIGTPARFERTFQVQVCETRLGR